MRGWNHNKLKARSGCGTCMSAPPIRMSLQDIQFAFEEGVGAAGIAARGLEGTLWLLDGQDMDSAGHAEEQQAEKTDTGPLPMRPNRGGGIGTERGPQKIAGHVDGVDATARGGINPEDTRLVGHLIQLGSHVEQDATDDQTNEVGASGPENGPSHGHQREREGNDRARTYAVGKPAGEWRASGSCGANDAETARDGGAAVVMRSAEQENQRGPKAREGSKHEATLKGGLAQHALPAEERPERT